jgi:hypothetical protein
MAATKELTVVALFSVEFEVGAAGEPEAIYAVAPKVQALEKFLNDEGYTFTMETLRVRRPRTAEKALEREARKRGEGA